MAEQIPCNDSAMTNCFKFPKIVILIQFAGDMILSVQADRYKTWSKKLLNKSMPQDSTLPKTIC